MRWKNKYERGGREEEDRCEGERSVIERKGSGKQDGNQGVKWTEDKSEGEARIVTCESTFMLDTKLAKCDSSGSKGRGQDC